MGTHTTKAVASVISAQIPAITKENQGPLRLHLSSRLSPPPPHASNSERRLLPNPKPHRRRSGGEPVAGGCGRIMAGREEDLVAPERMEDVIIAGGVMAGREENPAPRDRPRPEGGEEEDAERWFSCVICLGVISTPVVTVCGHIFCRSCLSGYMSLSLVEGSDCPLCKTRIDHLPRTCNLIGLVISMLHPGKGNGEGNADEAEGIRLEDVACILCKELLLHPSVLICGHVYCMPCLTSVGGEEIECQFCGAPHPTEPTVCSNLKNFLKHRFAEVYNSRQAKNPGVPGRKAGTRKAQPSKILHTHVGVGCDGCGVFPIQGRRYSCKECEAPGLDLCEECFMTIRSILQSMRWNWMTHSFSPT